MRRYLGWIARLTLLKHKPVVIAVVGSGPTSVMREVVYAALNETIPGRRNLELPEAELSIPLTVLDYPSYPGAGWKWLVVILKSLIQLVLIRPYKHLLVLEMQPASLMVLRYWLDITHPQFIINVSQAGVAGVMLPSMKNSKVVNVRVDEQQGGLEVYAAAAREVASSLGLDELDVELGLETMSFPEPRLRFFAGKAGSLIVDATYYYFPIRWDSVWETVEAMGMHTVVFTSEAKDRGQISDSVLVNPPNYSPRSGDVVLLRGKRTQVWDKYQKYLASNKLLPKANFS